MPPDSKGTAMLVNEQSLDYKLRRLFVRIVHPSTRFIFRHTSLNFDRAYGVDTAAEIPLKALSIAGTDAIHPDGYVPTSAKHFSFAMGFVPGPLDEWSLVDIGSGKGRIVLLAMGYPFRQVVGIELAPELHAIAQANLHRYRGARCAQAVELICGDATKVPLPPGDVVVFFYNSFHGETLRRFLDHLDKCLHEVPRRLVLIYSNPVERAAVDCRPTFTTLFDGVSPYDVIWWGNRRLIVYGFDVSALRMDQAW